MNKHLCHAFFLIIIFNWVYISLKKLRYIFKWLITPKRYLPLFQTSILLCPINIIKHTIFSSQYYSLPQQTYQGGQYLLQKIIWPGHVKKWCSKRGPPHDPNFFTHLLLLNWTKIKNFYTRLMLSYYCNIMFNQWAHTLNTS